MNALNRIFYAFTVSFILLLGGASAQEAAGVAFSGGTNSQGNENDTATSAPSEKPELKQAWLDQSPAFPCNRTAFIRYHAPEFENIADIIFRDEKGKIIRTYEINEPGDGWITIFSNDLPSGLLHYTLVADSKELAQQTVTVTK